MNKALRSLASPTTIFAIVVFGIVAGILTWRYISVNSDENNLPIVDAVNLQAREETPTELPPQISTAFSDFDTSAWTTISTSISNIAVKAPTEWQFDINNTGIDPATSFESIQLFSNSPGASPNIYYCVDIREAPVGANEGLNVADPLKIQDIVAADGQEYQIRKFGEVLADEFIVLTANDSSLIPTSEGRAVEITGRFNCVQDDINSPDLEIVDHDNSYELEQAVEIMKNFVLNSDSLLIEEPPEDTE